MASPSAISVNWRFIDSGIRSGAYNMALDEAIFREVQSGNSPPTLRTYGWNPGCVSLGHHQNPEREIDFDALARRGWGWVVRLTGGRAVLHLEEFTYAVIARNDSAPWAANQAASYDAISRALLAALPEAGLELSRERAYPIEKPQGTESGDAMSPCFTTAARSEITWEQKKVVGSAQRRTREGFLQHGSIPLTGKHGELVEVLRLSPAYARRYTELLEKSAVPLDRIAGRQVHWEEVNKGFMEKMAAALGIQGEPGELTEVETELCAELESAKREHRPFASAIVNRTPC